MTALTPEQIRAKNLDVEFLPASPHDDPEDPDTLPCLQLPDGKQVYAYYDLHGVLTVSVHLDAGDEGPIRVKVGAGIGETVYEEFPNLPQWDDLADVDKGIALVHVEKVMKEGVEYASELYAPHFQDERLALLSDESRSEHARRVVSEEFGDLNLAESGLGRDAYKTLCEVAYASGRA